MSALADRSGRAATQDGPRRAADWLRRRVNPIWLLALGLLVYFSVASPYFLLSSNIANILVQTSLLGFLALGLTPVMVSGNIDLTVGAVLGLAACLVISLQPYGLPLAIAGALGAGVLLGVLNGLIIERTGVNSFIVTLGGMIGIRGLAFLYAGDTSLSPVDDQLTELAGFAVGPIGTIVMLFAVAVVGFSYFLKHTPAGRNAYAIGGNRTAARDAGVPIARHIVLNFALSGAMAALCGIAMAGNLGAATPSFGKDYELWAIIAVVLGGTSLRGGTGSVLGTLGAVAALSILRNGLALLNVQPFYEPIIMGLTLVGALVVDKFHTIRRGHSSHE
jgi:ribose transport system permease protein